MDPQTINIVKFLIKETPIGNLKSVIDNLKILVGFEVLDSNEVKNEILKYEKDHLKHINIGDDKILLSDKTSDENGYFYDQNLKLRVNPIPNSDNVEKLETIEVEKDTLRDLLYNNFKSYKEKNFKSDITSINVFKNTNGYDLILSSHNLNLKNFWTGEWLSFWSLSNNKLEGKVLLNTYYFEEGNVQFKLKKQFSETLTSKDLNELSEEVINTIKRLEDGIQSELDQIYDSLSDNYLKPLRRRMPITGLKMNWNINQIAFSNK